MAVARVIYHSRLTVGSFYRIVVCRGAARVPVCSSESLLVGLWCLTVSCVWNVPNVSKGRDVGVRQNDAINQVTSTVLTIALNIIVYTDTTSVPSEELYRREQNITYIIAYRTQHQIRPTAKSRKPTNAHALILGNQPVNQRISQELEIGRDESRG